MGRSKKGLEILCVYCQQGTVKKLPAKCPKCGRSLKAIITPKMKLAALAERYVENGLRLTPEAVEGPRGIVFHPVGPRNR